MQVFTHIFGFAGDENIAEKIHPLSHADRVEYVTIGREDTLRRRLRATTNKHTECMIALSRDQQLSDGAVLELNDERAIVVRLTSEQWLALTTDNVATALNLGYFCGNLHWRVKFQGNQIRIAQEGPVEIYLSRLKPFLNSGKVMRIDHE